MQALAAAQLYSEDDTFQTIADKLDVSKSHAQVLVRKGLTLSLNDMRKSDPSELTEDNPVEIIPKNLGDHQGGRDNPFLLPPNLRRPESFIVETTGIGKRILLTPKSLMIYDIFYSCGFEGDISDFTNDAYEYIYQTRPPASRGANG